MSLLELVKFGADGLLPVVLQDRSTREVLLVAFMNREGLARTHSSGLVHLWSRSRGELWLKGESSGRLLRVAELRPNCELDSLLVLVDQALPGVCHTGHSTCFYRTVAGDVLQEVAPARFDPEGLYGRSTAELLTELLGAYAWLRDQPDVSESATWRTLQAGESAVLPRVMQEWEELLGVLDGTHLHNTYEQDVRLEGYQLLYWTALLHVLTDVVQPGEAAERLQAARVSSTLAEQVQAALGAGRPMERVLGLWSALGSALATAGVSPRGLISRDLSELAAKPYMEQYFSGPQRLSSDGPPSERGSL